MKFEKINKDKIKITFDYEDISQNDIDFNTFMTDSEENHSFFLKVLEKAEKDYDFSTKDYQLKIETVVMSNGCFILTITRVPDISVETIGFPKKKFKVRRKFPKSEKPYIIYKYESFEDFCSFLNNLKGISLFDYNKMSENSILYKYNNSYYLVLVNLNFEFQYFKSLFALLSEYGVYIDSGNIFVAKLNESGLKIFDNNAIQMGIKYFI